MTEQTQYYCYSCGQWGNEHESVKPCDWCSENAILKDRRQIIAALKLASARADGAAEVLRDVTADAEIIERTPSTDAQAIGVPLALFNAVQMQAQAQAHAFRQALAILDGGDGENG